MYFLNQFAVAYFAMAVSLLTILASVLTKRINVEQRPIVRLMIFLFALVNTLLGVSQGLVISVEARDIFRLATMITIYGFMACSTLAILEFPNYIPNTDKTRRMLRLITSAIFVICTVVTATLAFLNLNPKLFSIVSYCFLSSLVLIAVFIREQLLKKQREFEQESQVKSNNPEKSVRLGLTITIIPVLLHALIQPLDFNETIAVPLTILVLYWVILGGTLTILWADSNYYTFLTKLLFISIMLVMMLIVPFCLWIGTHLETIYNTQLAPFKSGTLLSKQEFIHKQFFPILVITILIHLTIFFGGAFYLRLALLTPLKQLNLGIKRFRAGEQNVQIAEETNDEFGILTSGFNQIVSMLVESQAERNSVNETLEKAVAERTKELQEVKISAEKATTEKTVFLAKMSHEFRTPLNAIIGFSQLLEKELPEPREATTIKHTGRYLLDLINDIFDITRGDINQLKLNPTEVNLKSVILQPIFSAIEPQLNNDQTSTVFKVSPLPAKVFVDQHRLRQIIVNMFTNAKQRTPRGKIQFEVKWLEQKENEATLWFSVWDSGNMIRPEEIKLVHEPFRTSSAPLSAQQKNLMSLILCHQLLQLMGSQLHIDCTPLFGNQISFTLCLPTIPVKPLPTNLHVSVPFKHDMVLPPPDLLLEIKAAARIGDIEVLENQVATLKMHYPHCVAFCKQMDGFIDNFQMKKLREWLDLIEEVPAL